MTQMTLPFLVSALVLLGSPPATTPATKPEQGTEEPAAEHGVVVHVTIRVPGKEKLPSLPLHLYVPAAGNQAATVAAGSTDESGSVTLQGRVSAATRSVFVGERLVRNTGDPQAGSDIGRATRDLESLRMKFYIPDLAYMGPRPRIDVSPSPNPIDFTFDASPAISIAGAVTDPSGKAPANRLSVYARASSLPARTGRNGQFRLFGVPKDAPNELFIVGFPSVQCVAVAAAQTRADLSLPPVPLPTLSDLFDFRVQLVEWDSLRERLFAEDGGRLFSEGVTLIRADGAMILTWMRSADQQYDSPRKAPAGRYYVVPGRFSAHPLQLRVLDTLRGSKDPSVAGIPVLEIPQAEKDELLIDASLTAETIEKLTTIAASRPIPGNP
jgi:hypothetical protein